MVRRFEKKTTKSYFVLFLDKQQLHVSIWNIYIAVRNYLTYFKDVLQKRKQIKLFCGIKIKTNQLNDLNEGYSAIFIIYVVPVNNSKKKNKLIEKHINMNEELQGEPIN